MSTEPPSDGAPPKSGEGLNPSLRRDVDQEFTEDQHGSEPMETVSVKKEQLDIWAWVWLGVTVALVLITIWLIT